MRLSAASFIAIVTLWAAVEAGMAQDVRVLRDGGTKPMSRVNVDGLELEYESRGSGEPVVLIHAGIFADWFKPLLEEAALTGR
ncbi:MAG TPA: hypothetical protein VLA62_09690, partial [Solirubrobacterales bacterium]|nr:hypothetical protein [Solirubrobacterales bacterium]